MSQSFYNKDLELVTLYNCCKDTNFSHELLASLKEEHFHYPPTKSAYICLMRELKNSHAGEIPTWYSICENESIDYEYREFLSDFKPKKKHVVKKKSNLEYLVKRLEAFRVKRLLQLMVVEVNDSLQESDTDLDEVLDFVTNTVTNARANQEKLKILHIGKDDNSLSVFDKVLDKSIKPNVLPTGLATFDEEKGGLPAIGVVVFAATTSSGKTTMATQLSMNFYRSGLDVCYLSLEMNEDQMLARITSNISDLNLNAVNKKLLTKKETYLAEDAQDEFIELGQENGNRFSLLCPDGDIDLNQAMAILKPYGYRIIVIDYLSLLKGVSTDWAEMAEATRQCVRYAKSLGILIILLAQLDEDSSKLRYSRAVKEHADSVWTWDVKDEDRETGEVEINQIKGRDQGLIDWTVNFIFESCKIEDKGKGGSNRSGSGSGKGKSEYAYDDDIDDDNVELT